MSFEEQGQQLLWLQSAPEIIFASAGPPQSLWGSVQAGPVEVGISPHLPGPGWAVVDGGARHVTISLTRGEGSVLAALLEPDYVEWVALYAEACQAALAGRGMVSKTVLAYPAGSELGFQLDGRRICLIGKSAETEILATFDLDQKDEWDRLLAQAELHLDWGPLIPWEGVQPYLHHGCLASHFAAYKTTVCSVESDRRSRSITVGIGGDSFGLKTEAELQELLRCCHRTFSRASKFPAYHQPFCLEVMGCPGGFQSLSFWAVWRRKDKCAWVALVSRRGLDMPEDLPGLSHFAGLPLNHLEALEQRLRQAASHLGWSAITPTDSAEIELLSAQDLVSLIPDSGDAGADLTEEPHQPGEDGAGNDDLDEAEETYQQAMLEPSTGTFLKLSEYKGVCRLVLAHDWADYWETAESFPGEEQAKEYAHQKYGVTVWKHCKEFGSEVSMVELLRQVLPPRFNTDQRCAAAWLAYSRVFLDREGFPILPRDGSRHGSVEAAVSMLDALDPLWEKTECSFFPDATARDNKKFMYAVSDHKEVIERSHLLSTLLEALSSLPEVSRSFPDYEWTDDGTALWFGQRHAEEDDPE